MYGVTGHPRWTGSPTSPSWAEQAYLLSHFHKPQPLWSSCSFGSLGSILDHNKLSFMLHSQENELLQHTMLEKALRPSCLPDLRVCLPSAVISPRDPLRSQSWDLLVRTLIFNSGFPACCGWSSFAYWLLFSRFLPSARAGGSLSPDFGWAPVSQAGQCCVPCSRRRPGVSDRSWVLANRPLPQALQWVPATRRALQQGFFLSGV